MEAPINIKLFEWGYKEYKYLQEPEVATGYLAGFQRYLNEVWESRNYYREQEDSEEGNEERSAKEQRFFSFSLDGFKARNYVGIVQYEGKRIEVYPKIFRDSKEPDYRSYFNNLFYWLSYCRRLNFPVSKSALDEVSKEDDFLEALIYLFAHYTEEVLTEQPFQAFEEVLEETPFLRGRLAMSEYIQQNVITGRWQYFQSEYEPLLYDNLFNRIVKYTSRILLELSINERNRSKLQEIQFLLDEVSDCVCVAADCDKVKLNPLYSNLADNLQLCKMFLSNLTISNDTPAQSNFCFLLPMEYVFEDFIFSFIKEHFPELKPEEQVGGFLAWSQDRNVFKIKNDILIRNRKLIVDTKYKIRYDDSDGKAGVSQNDLYQMLAYAVKRGYHDELLLYPEKAGEKSIATEFLIDSHFTPGKPVCVNAANVNIYNPTIKNLDAQIYDQLKLLLYENANNKKHRSIAESGSE